MKKVKIIAILFCAAITACHVAQTEETRERTPDKSAAALKGVDWLLTEIRTPEATVILDRAMLNTSGLGDAYCFFMEDGHIFGIAAPNRYSASCSLGDNFSISIGPAAVTQMAALKAIPLDENNFLNSLTLAKQWAMPDTGRLELYTFPDTYGFRTVLAFAAKAR
jgi:heat shock protein HslJ